MATGLVAINLFPLGKGINADAEHHPNHRLGQQADRDRGVQNWWEFLVHIVPTSVVEPFVEGNILQIIFMAVLFGIALNAVGKYGAPVLDLRPAAHRGRVQGPPHR